MNRYKLICLTPDGEEVFTVEGYESEREAQDMVDLLNATQGPPNTWQIIPLRYS